MECATVSGKPPMKWINLPVVIRLLLCKECYKFGRMRSDDWLHKYEHKIGPWLTKLSDDRRDKYVDMWNKPLFGFRKTLKGMAKLAEADSG